MEGPDTFQVLVITGGGEYLRHPMGMVYLPTFGYSVGW